METATSGLMKRMALGLLGLYLASQASAASWPAFRRDPARTGFAQEGAAPPLTLGWTATIGGPVLSSPVTAYGRVYIGSRDKKVYCLDRYAGTVLWSYAAGDWVDSTPALADGRLVVASRDGNLHALDALDGRLLWRYQTGSKDVGSPAVYAGEVYAATSFPGRRLNVLDARTGALRRSAELPQFATSSPALDPAAGRVFVGTSDGKYSALKLNLQPQWAGPVQTRGSIQFATPALAGARLLAAPGDDDPFLHAYDPATGAELWVSTGLSATASQATSVAVSSDTAFVGSGFAPHTLYALRLSDGGLRWAATLGNAGTYGVASSPAAANDVVYVVTPQGELLALAASSGAELARINLGGQGLASPAVADGWVYAATLDGKVHGFRTQRAWAISGPDPLFDVAEGVLTVTGTVASPQLAGYTVEFGSGTSPSEWTQLAQGTQPVSNAALAAWDTRRLEDGVYTLRLSVQETSPSGFLPEARSVFSVAQLKTAAVDPAAETRLSLGDGTEAVVPPGAVSGADVLTVQAVFSGYSDSGVPENVAPTSVVRRFALASTEHPVFQKPVRLKLPYSGILPRNEENLRLYFYDEGRAEWRIVNTSEVRKGEKRVSADVDHFTLFRIMEFVPSGTLLREAEVYAYPNPARGNAATFKFRVGDLSDVTIRVYDVSGGLVAEISKPGNPAGIASTLEWDISGRASGVYVYTLEARTSGGKKDSVTKKLAIIH